MPCLAQWSFKSRWWERSSPSADSFRISFTYAPLLIFLGAMRTPGLINSWEEGAQICYSCNTRIAIHQHPICNKLLAYLYKTKMEKEPQVNRTLFCQYRYQDSFSHVSIQVRFVHSSSWKISSRVALAPRPWVEFDYICEIFDLSIRLVICWCSVLMKNNPFLLSKKG